MYAYCLSMGMDFFFNQRDMDNVRVWITKCLIDEVVP